MSREVAIVTGGARGLGAAYVEDLFLAGHGSDFVTGQDTSNGGRLFN
jgi:NAD(P)-dependent dehydrogenase (short-subunit alcohol dehydrogenase family)